VALLAGCTGGVEEAETASAGARGVLPAQRIWRGAALQSAEQAQAVTVPSSAAGTLASI
jgi:hypothetical protein